MKNILFFILFLSVLSCNDHDPAENQHPAENQKSVSLPETIQANAGENQDTLTWIKSFRLFRSAVYERKIKEVKPFFNLPILNRNNEIWHLVYDGNKEALNLSTEKMKPFTEKDLNLYFDKLFPRTFINAILKIKTEEFYTKRKIETIEMVEGKTRYKMYATFNSADNILSLHLAFNTPVEAKDGRGEEIDDPGEYSIIYLFDVGSNGKIKFKEVVFAG